MQTILGSGGVIGNELEKRLSQFTDHIRTVSRKMNNNESGNVHIQADLLDKRQVLNAIEGSKIVYLVPGLKYNLKIWELQWPIIMKNVIDACRSHNAKLVFFDNVYMYGHVKGWMTEETIVQPQSNKGKVRAQIADMLMEAVDTGQIQALIARSADFYGPNAETSFVKALIFDKLAKGKKPMWMVNDEVKHSFTYTPDAAAATALLGNSPEAYDQIWHLPTDKNVLNGREFISLASETFDAEDLGYTLLKKWMLALTGIFNSIVAENMEMLYQFEYDYLFDSTKFEKHFDFKITSYKQGMIDIFNQMKSLQQTT